MNAKESGRGLGKVSMCVEFKVHTTDDLSGPGLHIERCWETERRTDERQFIDQTLHLEQE